MKGPTCVQSSLTRSQKPQKSISLFKVRQIRPSTVNLSDVKVDGNDSILLLTLRGYVKCSRTFICFSILENNSECVVFTYQYTSCISDQLSELLFFLILFIWEYAKMTKQWSFLDWSIGRQWVNIAQFTRMNDGISKPKEQSNSLKWKTETAKSDGKSSAWLKLHFCLGLISSPHEYINHLDDEAHI